MIYFIIFILILSIYEIHYILKNANDNKKALIIIYIFMAILVLLAGIYYFLYQYGNSIAYYIFKFLKIDY